MPKTKTTKRPIVPVKRSSLVKQPIAYLLPAAEKWNPRTTLADAWATANQAVGSNTVSRYTVPNPPMYTTPGEAALSSPAVVNDVVFVSTTKPGLYALCAHTGVCLWAAPGSVGGQYVLGPAIYGNKVVIGSGK